MKVKDLIEELNLINPEATVLVVSTNPELNGAFIEARGTGINRFERRTETFRDMMDNGTYSSEVYRRVFEGDGGGFCVTIS